MEDHDTLEDAIQEHLIHYCSSILMQCQICQIVLNRTELFGGNLEVTEDDTSTGHCATDGGHIDICKAKYLKQQFINGNYSSIQATDQNSKALLDKSESKILVQ